MSDAVAFFVALVMWATLITIEFVWAQRLTKYRKDIAPGRPAWTGSHLIFTQLNVSLRENYHPEGWPSLRRFLVLSVIRLMTLLAVVILFYRAFVVD